MLSSMGWIFDWAFLITALAGSAVGGWIDLKTTEIPDWVPAGMAVAGAVLHLTRAFVLADWSLLLWALAVAAAFLAFGYLMYFTGQWGEADALLLGAIGFLIPQPLAMFSGSASSLPLGAGLFWPLTFLLNMFIVGAIYAIAYSFVLAAKSPAIFPAFWRDVKENCRLIFGIFGAVAAALALSILILAFKYAMPLVFAPPLILFLPLILALLLFWRFATVLEKKVFRRRIPTSQLKPGDVIAEDVVLKSGRRLSSKLYIGLTKAQVAAVRAARKTVLIKEGIRYGPVFALTIVATWAWGNILFALVGL